MIGNGEVTVKWTFERIKRSDIGFSFVICRMNALDLHVEGQGYALYSMMALRQAFAEAWERLWVWHAAAGRTPGLEHVTSSNGFAAGQTDERAIASARGELIERAIFLEAWRTRRGWRPAALTTLSARLLSRVVAAHGWKVTTFRLVGKHLGTVIAGLARHTSGASIFDTVYAPDQRSHKGSEAKLMRSLMRSAIFGSTSMPDGWTLPEVGVPEDHGHFYRDPANASAFDFLQDLRSMAGTITLAAPEAITTRLVFSAGNLPAVAVATHPTWPQLAWGKRSIQEGNPWPHPLA
jgi:hypothetical protein